MFLYSFSILKIIKNIFANLSYNNLMPRNCKFRRNPYFSSSATTHRPFETYTRNLNVDKS